jgi:hypothetical protein
MNSVEKPLIISTTKAKRHFSRLWQKYPRQKLCLEMKSRKRIILSFVKKIASDGAPSRIMDLSCGYGWLTKSARLFPGGSIDTQPENPCVEC